MSRAGERAGVVHGLFFVGEFSDAEALTICGDLAIRPTRDVLSELGTKQISASNY